MGVDYLISPLRRAGRLCRIIVGTHPLVSTPCHQPKSRRPWLGIVPLLEAGVPRIHPVFIPTSPPGAALLTATCSTIELPRNVNGLHLAYWYVSTEQSENPALNTA